MPKWVKIVDCVVSCDLEVWRVALKYNRTPLLCYCQICASFHSHQWIQTGDIVRKRSIRVKIGAFMSHVTLKFDGRPRKNKAYLLCCFKFCASFNSHQLIIPPASTKLKGGILVSPCPSVRLSVRPSVRLWTESCPLCIFKNTHRIHFIFAHLIKQLQKVCRV